MLQQHTNALRDLRNGDGTFGNNNGVTTSVPSPPIISMQSPVQNISRPGSMTSPHTNFVVPKSISVTSPPASQASGLASPTPGVTTRSSGSQSHISGLASPTSGTEVVNSSASSPHQTIKSKASSVSAPLPFDTGHPIPAVFNPQLPGVPGGVRYAQAHLSEHNIVTPRSSVNPRGSVNPRSSVPPSRIDNSDNDGFQRNKHDIKKDQKREVRRQKVVYGTKNVADSRFNGGQRESTDLFVYHVNHSAPCITCIDVQSNRVCCIKIKAQFGFLYIFTVYC